MVILFDRQFIQSDDELSHSLKPGVLNARGVFETAGIIKGKLFAFGRHMDRMIRGLQFYKLKMPYTPEKIFKNMCRVWRINQMKDARCRISVWKCKKDVHHAIVCQPYRPFSDKKYKTGYKGFISDIVFKKKSCSHLKTLEYSVYRQAYLQAQFQDFDEALLLNEKKDLVEGSRTNVFFVRDKVLHTPAVGCGCLNGITRTAVLRLAGHTGHKVKVGTFSAGALKKAQEIFLTNSVIGIMPLTVLDGRVIGQGGQGPCTKIIREAYKDFVDKNSVSL